MGLPSFHSQAEGVLPVLVMNTVMSVALLKNMVRSMIQVVGGGTANPSNLEDHPSSPISTESGGDRGENCNFGTVVGGRRVVSISRFESLSKNRNNNNNHMWGPCSSSMEVECCVCLCGFEGKEEVSELSCKHFFHRGCLDKWFGSHHKTCPLCRSIL